MSAGFAGPGAVWEIHVDFHDDAGKRKKYFVALNDCDDAKRTVVAAFTTSREDRYDFLSGKRCGCPEKPCYRLEAKQISVFPLRTWVQFDNVNPMTLEKLRQFEAGGEAKFLSVLPDDLTRSLLSCAKKSDDVELVLIALVDKSLKRLEKERDLARKGEQTPPTISQDASVAAGIRGHPHTAQSILAELARHQLSVTDFFGLVGIAEMEIDARLCGPDGHAVANECDLALQLLKK